MYPSVSNNNDLQRELSFALPSAPPYPPPPSSTPPQTSPRCSNNGDPVTVTGIPVNLSSQINHPPNNYPSPVTWSTGLCDCFQDVSSCCLTWWCPCITFGRIAEIVDRGSSTCGVSGTLYTLIMCLTGCSFFYSCFYRSKLRGQYFLDESPCNDFFVHCCCEGCALCQEYRQLQNHGFDMSIGWHGNMERQRRLAAMAPAIEGGMIR